MTNSRSPAKIRVTCKHCGSEQLESQFVKSTVCRTCGAYFDVKISKEKEGAKAGTPAGAGIQPVKKTGMFATMLGGLLPKTGVYTVECYDCGHRHQVSHSAKSTICTRCSSYMDLQHYKITGPFSRNLKTQGKLTITAKGDFHGAQAIVRDALIVGELRGNLICRGEVRIKKKGKIFGGIDAELIYVEKKSDLLFMRSPHVKNLHVEGRVIASRIYSTGKVSIGKRGFLEGEVIARSFSVEKGGEFSGMLKIGEFDSEEVLAHLGIEPPGGDDDDRDSPLSQPKGPEEKKKWAPGYI